MSKRGPAKKTRIRKQDIAAAKLYRDTCLGKALQEALTTMQNQNKISEELREEILSDFDYEIITSFKKKVHTEIQPWTGNLCEYKQLDGVWDFHLKNVHFKTFPAPVSEDLFVKDLAIKTFKLERIPKPIPLRNVKAEKGTGKRRGRKKDDKKKTDKNKKKRATPKKKDTGGKKKKRGSGVKKERIPRKKTNSSAKKRPKVEKKKKKTTTRKKKKISLNSKKD